MTVHKAKTWLFIGWACAVAPLMIILVMRQLSGEYGNDAQDVWNWFSQFVLPTLTLLIGAFTVSAAPSDHKPLDHPMLFWVAAALSLFYIGLLYVVVGKQVFTTLTYQEYFKQTALFLGLIQAVVIGVVGKFFIESGR